MKRLLPLLALLLACDAFAENWERYARNREATRYYDTVRRVAMSGMAIIWDLHDLAAEASEQGKSYRSVLYPTEFNCRHLRKRVLSVLKMDGRMGSGAVVSENTMVGEWIDVPTSTPEAELMRIACSTEAGG